MGSRQGSHQQGSRVAAALIALCLAGCEGGYLVNVSSLGAPLPPPPNAAISVSGTSSGVFAALFTLGMLGVASGALPFRNPEMHPDRRIVERDCTMPIEDYSANLRCR